MPRNGSGVYTRPPGTDGIPDTTIESGRYNTFVGDVETDLNAARPIVAGGTGANSAAAARANIKAEVAAAQVINYDGHAFETGSFYSMPGATAAPSTNGLSGTAVVFDSDPNYIALEARDITTGVPYMRRKTAGTWGAWSGEDPTGKVNRSGDTMAGALTLPAGNPTALLHAAHKQYVDESIANAIALLVAPGAELRFNRSLNQHMTRLFNTTSSQQNWTLSTWVKRIGLGTHQALFGVDSNTSGTGKVHVGFDAGNHLCFFGGAAGDVIIMQGPIFSDLTTWLNIVWTAGGVSGGGPPLTTPKFHQLFVNNSGPSSALMNGNGINNAETHYIGQPSYFPDVIMKDVVFVDGLQVPPTSFGQDVGGVWTQKNYTGPFGVTGFKLNFGNATDRGRDISGAGNHWTAVNF